MSNLIIAIDGFSSTGKSTFARLIATRLGIIYLDSGAMYRTVTLHAFRSGQIEGSGSQAVIDEKALAADLDGGKVEIGFRKNEETGKFDICLGDECVEGIIRTLDISDRVSPVAALPFVRNFVDSLLHKYGSQGCVMDGRDIGTAVFPDADLKIFMSADAAIRAQRRLDEMKASGQQADFDDVLANVLERDFIDSHRDMNPLRKAADALELDNSHMTVDQQMEWLAVVLKERFSMEI